MKCIHDFVSACTRLFDGQGAVGAALPDVIFLGEGDRVEADLIHEVARRHPGLEYVPPRLVDLLSVADALGHDHA